MLHVQSYHAHRLLCLHCSLPNQLWREFTWIVETNPEEVAETVWAELPDKVQRAAEREGGTRKGIRTLLEKQSAEIAAVDDALGKSYCIYILFDGQEGDIA